MPTPIVLCATDDVPPGERKLVVAKGRPIVVFNLDGEFFALFNRCPHQGGSLMHGPRLGLVASDLPGEYTYCRKGEIVRCPLHGWEFDIRTGESVCKPDEIKTKRFDVHISEGHDLDRVLKAERVELKVQGRYLVASL